MDKILNWFGRNKDEPSEGCGPEDEHHWLKNQDATGYLNSVLQVLYMSKDFRERVASHTKSNPKTEYIDRELNDLFLELEGKVGCPVKCPACTVNIANKLKINNVHVQHDAAYLYEKILRLTSPEASQIFHGKLTNKNTCQKCHTQIETEAGFWHLPLRFSNDDDYSVERGLLNFFRSSVISGEDQMYCETCHEKCDTVMDCEITHPPEILGLLIRHIEFDRTTGKYKKICSFVDVPLVLNIQNQIYELHAFVEHFGEQRLGHKSIFVATIKTHNGIWHTFDDTYVIQQSRNFQSCPTVRSQTAYLLFYQRRKAAKYNGLVNQGATCYLNSVLQVLFMTEDFRESVKKHTRNNPATEYIDRELRDLFIELEKCGAYTYNITKKLKINNVLEQCDAAEHYEKILRLTSPEASQIFHGELTNSVTCHHCRHKTISTTRFWHLPLSLMDSHCSVDRSLQDFSHREVQLYCEKCDETRDVSLCCDLNHYPEVMVLLIKRFEYDDREMRYVKNNCLVEMPYTLDMKVPYELYASVDHCGELGNGHYIARIRAKDEGRWYIFDDISVISHNFMEHLEEKSQAAYLLFYRKQKDTFDKDVRPVSTQTNANKEQRTNDNKESEEDEEYLSNATVTPEIKEDNMPDETKYNSDVINVKPPEILGIQRNNLRKEREDEQELDCDNPCSKETCHHDMDRLVDAFSKMTITDFKESVSQQFDNRRDNKCLNENRGYCKHEMKEEDIQSDKIGQNYKGTPDQNWELANYWDEMAKGFTICAFESLMDFGGDLFDGLFESSLSEMPADLNNYRLKLRIKLKDLERHEKPIDGESLQAMVRGEGSVEGQSLPQPYRINCRDNDEDNSLLKKSKISITRLHPYKGKPEQRKQTRDKLPKERALSHKSKYDGVENLGVTVKGDTAILKFKPKKRQMSRRQQEQNE